MSLRIEVISDVICPWCYIGKRRLERALAALPGREVQVRWHPFQLNPGVPGEGIPRRDYRIAKFGSWERSQQLDARVAATGQGEGLVFDFDRMERTPNTFDAHRLIWLAGRERIQDAVVEALFRAYFTEARDLSDRVSLLDIVSSAGLDRSRAEAFLSSDEGTAEIRADEQVARDAGIQAVPYFLINDRVAVPGAVEPSDFLEAFRQADAEVPTGTEGATCQLGGNGRPC